MYQSLQNLASWATSARGICIFRTAFLTIQVVDISKILWEYYTEYSTRRKMAKARKETNDAKKDIERQLTALTFLLNLEKALRCRHEEVFKKGLESTGVLAEEVVDDVVDKLFTEVLPAANAKEFPGLLREIIRVEYAHLGSLP